MQPTIHLFHKSSRKFVEGKRASLANWFKAFFYALICLIGAGIIGYVLGGQEYFRQRHVDQDSKTTSATVSGGEQRTQDLFFVSYSLDYTYQVDGRLYSGSQGVSGGFWDAIRIGDSIDIRYSKTNPAESYIEGEAILGPSRIVGALLWMIAPAALLLGGGFVVANEAYRDQMSRTGSLITGSYKGQQPVNAARRSVTYEVMFDFVTPSGTQIRGKGQVTISRKRLKPDTIRQTFPSIGAPVLILYKDDKHYILL
ncbi:MAG: DUF3592 domain-containing protein [Anaerolineae bacterium]